MSKKKYNSHEDPTMPVIQTILHPTDFSDNSRYAFETACTLATQNNALLVLLHVIPPSVSPILDEVPPNPLQSAESQESWKGRFSWPQPPDPVMRIEHRVGEGDASDEILRLARALPCDLIVMGTHGRTGLSRLLAGSVAEEVLRNAPCPVLAVKTPLRAALPAEAESPAKPGSIVNVRPLGPALAAAKTKSMAIIDDLEIIRLIVPAGKEIPEHKAKGTVVVQCLEGQVAFTAFGQTHNLQPGELLCLPAGESHSLKGVRDASLLLTIVRPKPSSS
jgi:nucleotide-binding universal stress UspA family protein/mannose-6-phosphate isomerase-like protein (cupin superfamily)